MDARVSQVQDANDQTNPTSMAEALTQMIIDHDLRVTSQRTYAMKRIDRDFFGED
jgi:restriction endonuclease Mrr